MVRFSFFSSVPLYPLSWDLCTFYLFLILHDYTPIIILLLLQDYAGSWKRGANGGLQNELPGLLLIS
jgi:hypothetical protein